MTEKPKYVILAPLWGASYVTKFLNLTLPALMASRNLPILNLHYDVTLLLLAPSAARSTLMGGLATSKIRAVAKVEFAEIDDILSPENYGVSLTLAYARGLAIFAENQTSTTFTFLNADFILWNGFGDVVVDRMRQGSRAILCPSFRADEAQASKILRQAISDDAALAFAPVTLARLQMRYPHHSFLSTIVNRRPFADRNFDKIVWADGGGNFTARCYQKVLLALRPERTMEAVYGYCDFAFLPAMLPSGNVSYVQSSDEGFILELAGPNQGINSLIAAKMGISEMAASLSYWTTKEHRASASVLYRASIRKSRPRTAKTHRRFMSLLRSLDRAISPMSAPWQGHPYWRFGSLSVSAHPPSGSDVAHPPATHSNGLIRRRVREISEFMADRLATFAIRCATPNWLSQSLEREPRAFLLVSASEFLRNPTNPTNGTRSMDFVDPQTFADDLARQHRENDIDTWKVIKIIASSERHRDIVLAIAGFPKLTKLPIDAIIHSTDPSTDIPPAFIAAHLLRGNSVAIEYHVQNFHFLQLLSEARSISSGFTAQNKMSQSNILRALSALELLLRICYWAVATWMLSLLRITPPRIALGKVRYTSAAEAARILAPNRGDFAAEKDVSSCAGSHAAGRIGPYRSIETER